MVMKFNECCSKIKRKSTMLIAYGSKANRVSRLKDIRDPVSLLWQRKKKKTFENDPIPKLSRKYAPYISTSKKNSSLGLSSLLKLQIQIDCQMSETLIAFIYNFLKDRKQKPYLLY